MSLKQRLLKLTQAVCHSSHFLGNATYLFIFSHMRSRSSVLSHVLGSNPGVCGYYELKNTYRTPWDLFRMRMTIYEEIHKDLTGKYLLDKILHNRCRMSSRILNRNDTRILFLLREPESTLKSIIAMGRMTEHNWYQDPAKASDYYCKRLKTLERTARDTPRGWFFIASDDLVDQTNGILKDLSLWLNLDPPLSRYFDIFSKTGKAGSGDPSPNIRTGIIQKTPKNDQILIPQDCLKQAQTAYERCFAILSRNQHTCGKTPSTSRMFSGYRPPGSATEILESDEDATC